MTYAMRDLIKRQFEDQLIGKWLGEKVIRTRKDETLTAEGYLVGVGSSEIVVDGIIVSVTEKDREAIDMGFAEVGDAHGYFKLGTDVKMKDFITSQTTQKKYQVTKIDDNTEVIHGMGCFLHIYMVYRETIT